MTINIEQNRLICQIFQQFLEYPSVFQNRKKVYPNHLHSKVSQLRHALILHPAEGLRALRPRVLPAEGQGRGRPDARAGAAARTRRDARGAGGMTRLTIICQISGRF